MEFGNFDLEQINGWTQIALSRISAYTPRIIWALIVLFVWLWLVRWASRIAQSGFRKAKMDTTVSTFLSSLISIWLRILLLISVASMFGVKTTSFIALLWAAGLAIWLSLQGSLSNFAGGVLILLFKPYKVKDLIEIQWIKWHVNEISVLTTTLITLENNHAIIPNGPIINDKIINYSKKKSIRVDAKVWISYHENIDKARKTLLAMVAKEDHILTDPAPQILVNELWDSSVNLLVRAYTRPEYYWDVYFSLTENAKKALDKSKIEIPFPQRVVHIQNEEHRT